MGTEPKYKRILLKISGEALAGDAHRGTGLRRHRRSVRRHQEVRRMGVQVGVVVGGGNFWRGVKDGERQDGAHACRPHGHACHRS